MTNKLNNFFKIQTPQAKRFAKTRREENSSLLKRLANFCLRPSKRPAFKKCCWKNSEQKSSMLREKRIQEPKHSFGCFRLCLIQFKIFDRVCNQQIRLFLFINLLPNSPQSAQRPMKICQVSPNSPSSKLAKEEPLPRAEGTIKFYLRRPNKQTLIVYETSQFKGKQLLKLAQQKMQIDYSNLVLFLKGERIDSGGKCPERTYELKQNDIVHVHNAQNSSKGQITIILKSFQCPVEMEQLFCISVKVEEKIGQSLQNHLEFTPQMAFVESGRVLDKQKTFREESVEDQSEIIITTFDSQKSEKKEKQQNQQSSDIQILVHKQPKSSLKKTFQYEDFHSKPSLKKSCSWGAGSCNLQPQLNFKKKQKPSIYKSMKILDGKEIVWESDGSGDLNKKLLQKMPLRKHKSHNSAGKQNKKMVEVVEMKHEQDHMMLESDDSSENDGQSKNMFSSSERKELKNELNKLLFSGGSEAEKQVTKLQPPQMLDDDFLEESEEIQIVPDDEDDDLDEQDDDEEELNVDFKPLPSMDLRQSIGKSRGEFVLPMIPTRDFEMKQDSDDSDEE